MNNIESLNGSPAIHPLPSFWSVVSKTGKRSSKITGLKRGWWLVSDFLASNLEDWASQGNLRPYTIRSEKAVCKEGERQMYYVIFDCPPDAPTELNLPLLASQQDTK